MASESRPNAAVLAWLNALAPGEAGLVLERCCGAARWVEGMVQLRPFASAGELLDRAATVWQGLQGSDFLEAFSHHPEIGANLDDLRRKFAATAPLALGEQAGAINASEATLQALRSQNQAYRARFGYSFIVCATGKTASEMLELLEARLHNAPEVELGVAAAEQAKITRLRLEKLTP
jgi:2-oxo-4-hydroxy-4-carboxy-5-ureidoimidazoline decarboxylase